MRTRKSYLLGATIAAAALILASCSDSEGGSTTSTPPAATDTTQAPATTVPSETSAPPATTAPTTEAPGPTLTLDVQGFAVLEAGFHYEGWAIVEGEALTTGKFNVTTDGAVVSLDGEPIESFPLTNGAENASVIVVTIEPAGDTDAVPAATHIVAGDVSAGSAELTISHGAALGTDFSDSTGRFVLATPSTDTKDDELSGIWFLTFPGPEAGLDLPALPDGWKYEGWAVIDGTPFSSGTFTDVAAGDDAAPFGGPGRTPAFPGEDYVANAPDGVTFPTDLSGETVVVSVEPDPDDSPAPFVLKPLVGAIPDPAEEEPVAYDLGLNLEALPSGVATISS